MGEMTGSETARPKMTGSETAGPEMTGREMAGRVAMVTGANSGIGKAVAVELARRGARVVMVCRSEERGRAALAEARAAGGGEEAAELLPIDLASLAAVRAGAAGFLARHERLHVLVNNAGLFSLRRRTSADGFELTFAVNQLAPFLLTRLLLPRLTASAPARIVNVASHAHYGERMHWDDLQLASYPGHGRIAYGQSKLANVLFARELARRLEGTGVVANAVHPGVVATGIVRGTPFFVRWWFRAFGLTAEQGAEGPVMLAAAPEMEKVTGRYFSRTREATPSPAARDAQAAARLWEVCEQLTGPV
jgi:NAD(P)-dependent dehydrogenase (short-subunit alcohol dehydrogenase family)